MPDEVKDCLTCKHNKLPPDASDAKKYPFPYPEWIVAICDYGEDGEHEEGCKDYQPKGGGEE